MHIRVYCIRISLTLKLLLYLGSIEVQVEVFVSTAASQPAEQVPHTLGLRRLLLLLGREFGLQSHAIMPFTMKLSEKHRIQLFFAEGKTVKRLLHSVQLIIISLYRN